MHNIFPRFYISQFLRFHWRWGFWAIPLNNDRSQHSINSLLQFHQKRYQKATFAASHSGSHWKKEVDAMARPASSSFSQGLFASNGRESDIPPQNGLLMAKIGSLNGDPLICHVLPCLAMLHLLASKVLVCECCIWSYLVPSVGVPLHYRREELWPASSRPMYARRWANIGIYSSSGCHWSGAFHLKICNKYGIKIIVCLSCFVTMVSYPNAVPARCRFKSATYHDIGPFQITIDA